jgi:hypothetical protein
VPIRFLDRPRAPHAQRHRDGCNSRAPSPRPSIPARRRAACGDADRAPAFSNVGEDS